jgi:signal transduction histidine kinase
VVVVSTSATPEWVEIAVRDTGPGLLPDQLDRATDRFWRGSAENSEGSGLGLAIAARTVELAGGGLRLERPPRGGLRVVVRLRRAGNEPPTVPMPNRPDRIEMLEPQKASFPR